MTAYRWAFGLALFWLSSSHAGIDHSIAASVVQIQAKPPHGDRVFMGSGVVVGPGQVVTNCHVTIKADVILVRKGGLRLPANAQHVDVKRDLCVLDVPGLRLPAAHSTSVARLKSGEVLYLLGFPRALGMSWSKGYLRSLHPYRGSQIIETSAGFVEGASGGGLFNEESRLVGIATFFSSGSDRHYFAVPADWINVVRRLKAKSISPFPGIPFWQDMPHLPSFLRPPKVID